VSTAEGRRGGRVRRASRISGGLSAFVLAALGIAYWWTCEPAFEVAIRWADGTSAARLSTLERRHGLESARTIGGGWVAYDLVDTRAANLQELLQQPEVQGGEPIDAATYQVPPDAPYGRGWMWIADRLPVSPELRLFRLVPALITVCAMTLAAALAAEVTTWRRSRG
jgi:hypothetical protein